MYRLIEKLHLERYLNTRLILAIDLAVSGLASLCALVSVKLLLHLNISDYTLLWLCCSVVYSFVTFYLLKTYHSVIRHSTLREIAKFVVAVIGKELLLGLTILLYPPTPLFGMHMLALLLFDLLLTLCGLILIRVAMIIVYDLVKNNLKSRKQRQLVLVYGLSEKSVSLVTRFFMTIPEACQLVMEAATISTGNQICVFDMGKSVKIADLAKRMIELAGYEPGEEIKIEYTGLRPGEKLYEEVLSNTENTIPTTHDRIRIAKVREYDYAEACAATGQLEQFARMVNVPDTVCLMKKIVPEFKSKNSEFERFDKVQPA